MKEKILEFINTVDIKSGLQELENKATAREITGKTAFTTRAQINAVSRIINHIQNTDDNNLPKFDLDFAHHALPGATDFRILTKLAMQMRYGTQNPKGLSQNSDYINGSIIIS